MMLDACPLCKKIKEKDLVQDGLHCVIVDLDGERVVALKRHESAPTSDEALEACALAKSDKGVVGSVDIPGHWAISIKKGEWQMGKSMCHSEDPQPA